MVSRVRNELGKFAIDKNSDHFNASNKKLLAVWRGIKHRCFSPKSTSYRRYGGRGITICEEWLNSYLAFEVWAFENGYSDGLSIDRIDVNGNYSPLNCRWVDMTVQAKNKRNSVLIAAFGETKNLIDWAKDSRCSVDRETISFRMRNGMAAEESISLPKKGAFYEGFGEIKSALLWYKDSRCNISRRRLAALLLSGQTVEKIFADHPREV